MANARNDAHSAEEAVYAPMANARNDAHSAEEVVYVSTASERTSAANSEKRKGGCITPQGKAQPHTKEREKIYPSPFPTDARTHPADAPRKRGGAPRPDRYVEEARGTNCHHAVPTASKLESKDSWK